MRAMAEASARPTAALIEETLAGQATPTFLQPADLAGAFLFLASDGALPITGQALVVSHGEVMN
jgi:NAD(P)-dependent dehydrogenase (short-subunit alcohol dehydrogenase family)